MSNESEGHYQEMQGLLDQSPMDESVPWDSRKEAPPAFKLVGAERIVQITTGLYRTAQGVTSHTLYCLSNWGRMWKMTKDGWQKLDNPAGVDEEDPNW